MQGFDDSFDPNIAGGWEDASFASSQTTPDAHLTDKVPLPSTIADLNALGEGAERITVGSNSFTTVGFFKAAIIAPSAMIHANSLTELLQKFYSQIHVVGQVKKAVVMDGGQSIEYTLSDYHDQSREFLIIHYKGVSDTDMNTTDVVVEGTDVSVVGKLRSFNGRLCVVAFDVREIENKKEIDIFHLEAKLARLYYSKNIPEMAAAGNLSKYSSTMVRGADTGSPEASNEWSNNVMPKLSQARNQQTYDDFHGLKGQKAEIFRFLRSNGDPVIGASVQAIRTGIPRNVFNEHTFQMDMDFLASEGLIYATSDDDHFAANS